MANYGAIEGLLSYGAYAQQGDAITNGSASDATALISGRYIGIFVGRDALTVTNFGSIEAADGIAVEFESSRSRLIAESGSTFVGVVLGSRGTLELASGAGTVTGLGAKRTISGAEAMTFSGFGVYQLDAASTWTLSGTNLVNAGDTLVDYGNVSQQSNLTAGSGSVASSLSIANDGVWTIDGDFAIASGGTSTLDVSGTLVNSGAPGATKIGVAASDMGLIEAATGTLTLARVSGSGVLQVDAGAVLEVKSAADRFLRMMFNGGSATLALKSPARFKSVISGFAATDTIQLLKTAATAASINAKDQLVVVNGTTIVATLKLTGSYQGATFKVRSDKHGGTEITLLAAASAPSSAGATQAFAALMAGLTDPGSGPPLPSASPAGSLNAPRLLSPGAH